MSKSPKLDPRLQYGGNPALEAVGANKWPPCQDHSGARSGCSGRAAPTASLSLSPESTPVMPVSRPLTHVDRDRRSAKPRAMTPGGFPCRLEREMVGGSSDLASIGAVRHAFLILGALRHGAWLRLPLRKLDIERVGLLHDDPSTATYAWMAVQRKQQALTGLRDNQGRT